MVEAIIFDMDGVLIDSEVYYFKRRMNFFAEVQLSPGSRAINDYVGKTEAEIWQMLVPENPSLRAELKTTYRAYQKQHPIDFEQALRKEVKPVLKKLSAAGIPMALASSSPRRMIDEMLTACQLQSYFCYVISGEELTQSKPHPEIYQLAQNHLDCEQIAAVEDSPIGIQSAKAAGIYTIALKQPFDVDQSQADQMIDSLEELLSLFIE